MGKKKPGKRKPEVELYSYGIYSPWDRQSRDLPELKAISTTIPVQPEVEFGYVLRIRGGKGYTLTYEINHPPIQDKNGEWMPSFTGDIIIPSNDWEFFLGDTVWEPFEEKAGQWILITRIQGREVARKSFELRLSSPDTTKT